MANTAELIGGYCAAVDDLHAAARGFWAGPDAVTMSSSKKKYDNIYVVVMWGLR